MIIDTATLSSALIYGQELDKDYFKKVGSDVLEIFELPIIGAKNFLGKIVNGGKELVKSVFNGTFGKIFGKWAKESPVAAGAGVLAAGLALGTVIVVGGAAVGVLAGGGAAVGAVGTALGGLGSFGAGAAKVAGAGATFLTGTSLLTGKSVGQLVTGALNFAETIYSFNFNKTDEEINKEIESTINALYGPTGEYIGQQVAGVLVGGIFNPPKVQINIRALQLAWDINPDIRDDLLNNTSSLAYLGITAFRRIAVNQAYMKGRQGIKDAWGRLPEEVRSKFPNLNSAITNWGAKGSKPWSIQGFVEKKIEELDDQKLQDLSEGLIEGFWEQFRQSVEYVYY
ncbi:MAG: hypothetical protein F6K48_15890 [Okeania sp. SIO3H1]|uniref:hypothetical protein n=1 Tax=Okeania sp. SIO1I7 TaxID=2607772 RepID=UPI0013C5CB30|nr:hypothetical protein [Okeania sp. SIO1I7]NEN90309.1 hypothetical protein [Okeania sp. SIO3H1]NET29530.1 hypothetical protein [Okeania sp. SIO1I7]